LEEEKVSGVTIRRLGIQRDSEAARRAGRKAGADLVIWGWVIPGPPHGMRAHFEALTLLWEAKGLHPTISAPDSFQLGERLVSRATVLVAFTLGLIHYFREEYDLAVKELAAAKKATYEDKEVPPKGKVVGEEEICFYKGNAHYFRKELDLAIADYTEAIGIKPDDEAAFNNRGLTYFKKAELVEERDERLSLLELAIADYNKAIELKHDLEAAFNNRGLAYTDKAELVEEREERLSLLELAIADFSKAIGIKHDFAEAYANRGFARIGKAELKAESEAKADLLRRAIEDCERALELGTPNDALVSRRLAYAYFRLGDVHYDAKR
jgi:tetratricopeptide (TPR) repeat protein